MGNKKKAAQSYKEIALRFIELCTKLGAEGAAWSATKDFAEQQGVRRGTLRRAADYLVDEYGDKRMQVLVDEEFPAKGRGRALPSEGEWRNYAMQESAGRQFLRIPGRHTGVKKGRMVRVGFLPGNKIVIVPKPPTTPKAPKRKAA